MAYISKWKLKNGTVVPVGSNLFGHCGTASGTQTKVVTLADFDVLVEGITVHVHFQYKNTANGALLQVGNTVAKAIRYNGTPNGDWADDSIVSFTYYGDMWCQNDYQAGGGGGSSYGLDYDPDTSELSLVPDGQTQSVTLPNGVTYTLSISGDTLTLVGSDGSTSPVTLPSNSMSLLSYGHSTWNDFITAYQTNSIVYCRASSNSNPGTGSQNRLAFMAYVNNATNPTEVEFQYYRSVATHSDNQQGDQVYVYKLNSLGTWSVTVRSAFTRIDVGNGLTKAYSSGTLTLSGKTYALSISGHDITLTDNDGNTDTVTVPDDNTTYTISISGNDITLTPSSGTAQTITVPDDDTTYSLSISGNVITLTGSDGSTDSVTVPDDDTTYTLSINNHSIELVGSDSTTSTVVLPIYALSGDDAQATLTDSYGNTSVAVYPTYTIYKNYDEIVLARDYGGLQTEVARVTDDNTAYGLQFVNGTLTLVASGGTASVSIPDTNTTYSLSLSGSTLTLTGSDGSTSSVTISGGNIVDVQVDGTSVVDAQGVANIILPEEIFFAEYNVTSFADITSAINDGKAVYAVYSNYIAPLVHTSSGSYVFSMTYDPGGVNPQALRFIVTSADVWSYNLSSLALYSDIPTVTEQSITTYSSGWTNYDSANIPKVRKYGKVVSLLGAMKNNSAVTLNTSGQTMFSIPSAYVPTERLFAVCQGSGSMRWLCSIETNGVVAAARYTNTTTYPSVSAGSWFPFTITWVQS